MTGLLKAGIESELTLGSSIRETFEALLEIGVVIGKPGSRSNRHHHSPQVGLLEQSRGAASRQAIEIQQAGAASSSQHAPKLPEPSCRVRQIAQPIGHQSPIGKAIRHVQIQSIALLPAHWKPGLTRRPLRRDRQRCSGSIHTHHSAIGAQSACNGQGQITGTATEVQPLFTWLRRQLENHPPLPLTMQAKAEPVVQPVVTGRSIVEQLFNSVSIAGFQSGKPLNVMTITVARPTAAEHTMQPASISENSP